MLLQKLIITGLSLLVVTGCTLNTKETFLIPEGYKGRVKVSFNHHNGGAKQEFEPNTYVFRIPANGELLSAHVNDRCDNPIKERFFYYLAPDGKRIPIPQINNPAQVPVNQRDQIKIFHFKTDYVAKKYPPYNILYQCLHTFIVDSYNNLPQYNSKDSTTNLVK